jgi:hypothetical protein
VIFSVFGPMCISTVFSFFYVYSSTTGNAKVPGLIFPGNIILIVWREEMLFDVQ